eukprot:CAMPEP_0202958500 /NCGR_PEP_ID=MMETSP1396-20130829/2831_1 /ASSEMBLY_ACC=CAM_ASM_000872 /TAXON_ID= /ORGANISM="Pseudokeronopsis sp., Strain Brazil" /LENGTH=64 /DNA_ID=CAMNT_0049676609 /DNA_START=1616 /DNA_END=1810 /DNA_ORIENTATION=+
MPSPKATKVSSPKFGLTPVLEEFRELALTSTKKKAKDDFDIDTWPRERGEKDNAEQLFLPRADS